MDLLHLLTKKTWENVSSCMFLFECSKNRGGLGRLAAWHLPGGPVGPASRWATICHVEVGHMTYPTNRDRVGGRERRE